MVDQSQVDLLLILHDSLVVVFQGLDELLVDTTGGVMDERVALELEFLEELGIQVATKGNKPPKPLASTREYQGIF